MISKELLKDKVQDLMALEVLARDLFNGLLSRPLDPETAREITRLKQDEERHIGLVSEMIALLEGRK